MKITILTPDLDPMLRKLIPMIRDRLLFVKLWANAAAMEARDNARRKGGRRYWRDLARSIQVRQVSATEATVNSNQVGANIKQFGGVIVPKKASALTIPIAPEAHGKTAYELNTPKRPLFRPKGTNILAWANKDGTLKPLFALSKRSVQMPDRWFPDDARIAVLGRREAALLIKKEQATWSS